MAGPNFYLPQCLSLWEVGMLCSSHPHNSLCTGCNEICGYQWAVEYAPVKPYRGLICAFWLSMGLYVLVM